MLIVQIQTGIKEEIHTKLVIKYTVGAWKKTTPTLQKKFAQFLIQLECAGHLPAEIYTLTGACRHGKNISHFHLLINILTIFYNHDM